MLSLAEQVCLVAADGGAHVGRRRHDVQLAARTLRVLKIAPAQPEPQQDEPRVDKCRIAAAGRKVQMVALAHSAEV